MEPLKCIAYASTSSMPMTEAALESLLVEARGLNTESGVTGILLCSEASFVQYVEGGSTAIDITWGRIRNSRRHKDVHELMHEEIRLSSFPAWEMGFKRAAASDLLALSTANWERMSRLASSGEAAGFQLLQQFWTQAR